MKQVSPPHTHEFLSGAPLIRALADKHFPHAGYERDLLLDVADKFDVLFELRFNLDQVLKKLEPIRAMSQPSDFEVLHLSLYLKNIAAALGPETDSGKAATRGGEVLQVWFDLYSYLEKLLKASASIRPAPVPGEGG